jgi:CheY-like chemotaxis protein
MDRSGSTILVADSDTGVRELLVELPGYAGHHVLEAHDGAEALQVVRAVHPDL